MLTLQQSFCQYIYPPTLQNIWFPLPKEPLGVVAVAVYIPFDDGKRILGASCSPFC
jgi:hypothetical protein